MKKCPKCQAGNLDSASYCSSCGAELPEQKTDSAHKKENRLYKRIMDEINAFSPISKGVIALFIVVASFGLGNSFGARNAASLEQANAVLKQQQTEITTQYQSYKEKMKPYEVLDLTDVKAVQDKKAEEANAKKAAEEQARKEAEEKKQAEEEQQRLENEKKAEEERLRLEAEQKAAEEQQQKITAQKQAEEEKQAQEEKAKQTVKQETAGEKNSYTVYITNTGSKYHRSGCQYLKQSKIAISKDKAVSEGYTACKKCNP